jgi:hypothetical protein
MKIFNALVAYLTVTALPFTPFAFAHPLAASIDHDGFVNTRQNQNDGDLMKRVPDDIIEARQLIAIVEVALVLEVIAIITVSILLVDREDAVRAMKRSFIVANFFDNSILPETRGVY